MQHIVPHALLEKRRWILWRYVGEDRRKVPFQTSGQPAKSNDPTTWTDYQTASVAMNGTYAGLGYVFAAEDRIFGIDLDGCIGTDGAIQPWAAEIIAAVPTYAEISPSGTGVKLFGIGRLPGGGRKREIDAPPCCDRKPAVEVYGQGRYFTFTGRRLVESPEDLQDCQAAIDTLYQRLWPEKKISAPLPSGEVAHDVCDRARLYLDRVPPAVSGSGGHNQTFRAACVLVLGFGLSPDHAFPLLAQWNETCLPPWSEKELRHKLADADKKPGERGWLLDGRGYSGSDVDLCRLLESLAVDSPASDTPIVVEKPSLSMPQECIDAMPWLMRLAYDWILETAIKPQPELTLGALLAMFGAIFGRLVRDDYGTRTNIMVLGLSPSGSGKEHPRQKVKEILLYAGLEMLNGPERIGSHAGIVSSLAQHPIRLFQVDEIGRLLATMRDPKGSPHLYNVGTVLMQLYSSSGSMWTGDAYADLAKVKRINQPCLCMFGTSVPEGFYAGLSPENLSDGLLGRMLTLEATGYGIRRKPKDATPPWELTEAIKAWRAQPAGSGNLSSENPSPMLVQKTPEADHRHEQYCNEVHQRHGGEDETCAALWSRAPEKEAKLALIYACCATQDRCPMITLEAVDWARRLVNHSTRLVISRAGGSVSMSKYDEEKKKVWRKLRSGMSLREFSRLTQWIRNRERAEILDDWVRCGAIEMVTEQTATKPKTVIRKLRENP